MSSLIFRALDQHVVDGLADHDAIIDDRGSMSYAQLLHESAALAGAMVNAGIGAGTEIAIELPIGREQVVAVLACARIGAVPNGRAGVRFAGTPPVLHTSDTEITWDTLMHAGRLDPAPAPAQDPDGYEKLMKDAYEDVFATLTAGRTIT